MKQRSQAFRFVPVLGVLAFLAMLGAPPAWGQGNSPAASWCAQHFPPGQRGQQCVSQAAQGTGPFVQCGPGSTTGQVICGSVCCPAGDSCVANACATPTPTNTPTATPTSTPTATPTDTPCAADTNASPRFVDNRDGTVTDRHTCLVWEKKDDAGGIHDWDNRYSWCDPDPINDTFCRNGSSARDGKLWTEFLATLNTPPCFAGHCDWRLPSEEGLNDPFTGPKELDGIVDRPPGEITCFPAPCVDPVFDTYCSDPCTVDGAGGTTECSCTAQALYWSSTESTLYPGRVWLVNFGGGDLYDASGTTYLGFVRAVRGGS